MYPPGMCDGPLQVYDIEKSEEGEYYYRFYSLYNGMRGKWYLDKKDAIAEGKSHEKIIYELLKK